VDAPFSGFEASQWYGVGAPKNTPLEIVDKLNREINAGLADGKLSARLAELGGTVSAWLARGFQQAHRRRTLWVRSISLPAQRNKISLS
jgi:hypothetical protein